MKDGAALQLLTLSGEIISLVTKFHTLPVLFFCDFWLP